MASETAATRGSTRGDLALLLTGGGARAAYQVGVLAHLARRFPGLRIPIFTGVSAGALNVAYLAAHQGTFAEAVRGLAALWGGLTPEQIFRTDVGSLAWHAVRWGIRLASGGLAHGPQVRGFLDTRPLRELLENALALKDGGILAGIEANLRRGAVNAVAVSTTNYSTGQSVIWVQGCQCEMWTRPQRKAVQEILTVDHIMASAALPLFFPAVRIGDAWYADGGVSLTAPLSPAIHIGAGRILAISTRHARTREEADRPSIVGYPPPAQVAGILLNAVFLELIDEDALRLRRLNQLLEKLPDNHRGGLRHVELLVLRPSCDLGRLALEYERQLPSAFRFMTRGLGTRETLSADLLSMLLFQSDYLKRLMAIGEADAEAHGDEIVALLETD